jgi:hypothetical protein
MTKGHFKVFFEVWVGHCEGHIYQKFMNFLVNMWFSTNWVFN